MALPVGNFTAWRLSDLVVGRVPGGKKKQLADQLATDAAVYYCIASAPFINIILFRSRLPLHFSEEI